MKRKTHRNLVTCKTCQNLGIVKIGHKPGTPCPNKRKLSKIDSTTLSVLKSLAREGFQQNTETKTINEMYDALSSTHLSLRRYEREVPQELSSRFKAIHSISRSGNLSGKIFFQNTEGEWEYLNESEEGRLLVKEYNSVKTEKCEIWFDEKGKPSRKGEPAIIWKDGTLEYYREGMLDNRNGGPAMVLPNGDEEYYADGALDCASGSAVRYADGGKRFFRKGKLENFKGPAVDLADGTKEWWVNDVKSDNPELCDFIVNGPRLSLDEEQRYVEHSDYVVRRLTKFHYGRY